MDRFPRGNAVQGAMVPAQGQGIVYTVATLPVASIRPGLAPAHVDSAS
jgi:hypothetical protein